MLDMISQNWCDTNIRILSTNSPDIEADRRSSLLAFHWNLSSICPSHPESLTHIELSIKLGDCKAADLRKTDCFSSRVFRKENEFRNQIFHWSPIVSIRAKVISNTKNILNFNRLLKGYRKVINRRTPFMYITIIGTSKLKCFLVNTRQKLFRWLRSYIHLYFKHMRNNVCSSNFKCKKYLHKYIKLIFKRDTKCTLFDLVYSLFPCLN